MQYIKQNPKKSKWNMWIKRDFDNNIREIFFKQPYIYSTKSYLDMSSYEDVKNFVFYAVIKFVKNSSTGYSSYFIFKTDNGVELQFTCDDMRTVFESAKNGKNIKFNKDGTIEGYFTFRKNSGYVNGTVAYDG